tara:strand:- start:848 stop:1237 length:390 start_codon:yes stop_codon:yes gene_type:complete
MFSDRINIQYSIDSDELPREVQRLFEKVDTIATQFAGESGTQRDPNTILSLQTIEEIDIYRRKLAAMDYILGDLTNIISSYIDYKMQKSQSPEPPSENLPEEEDIVISQDSLFRDLDVLHAQVDTSKGQ